MPSLCQVLAFHIILLSDIISSVPLWQWRLPVQLQYRKSVQNGVSTKKGHQDAEVLAYEVQGASGRVETGYITGANLSSEVQRRTKGRGIPATAREILIRPEDKFSQSSQRSFGVSVHAHIQHLTRQRPEQPNLTSGQDLTSQLALLSVGCWPKWAPEVSSNLNQPIWYLWYNKESILLVSCQEKTYNLLTS